MYVQLAAPVRPTLSVAVGEVAVCAPTVAVSSVTVPLAAPASPEWASLAAHGAVAVAPWNGSVAGHVIETSGSVASTFTVSDPESDSLPTTSATVPPTVCEPFVARTCAAVIVAASTPEPALASGRAGSPFAANDTVTESRYQPPSPA